MDWEIVTWGLLIGIVGMVWMMVLSILNNEGRKGSHRAAGSRGQDEKEAA